MREDLSRLRRENNRLLRRLHDLETTMFREIQTRDGRIGWLEAELAAIKSSRIWRTAVRLRELLDRVGGARKNTPVGSDSRAGRYERFVEQGRITPERRAELSRRATSLARKPVISIVMPVYNVAPVLLEDALHSIVDQVYEKWELCLVDDASDRSDLAQVLQRIDDSRIKAKRLEQRVNISSASNHAIDMTTGEYVAFMDHDDMIPPEALLEVASAVNETGAELIYTDEDAIDMSGNRLNPHFKPDFSPDLLLSHNYMTHLVVVSRSLLERVGSLRGEYDGAQDYDFVLRATEQATSIHHIPEVLYHWRLSDASTSLNADAKPQAEERGRRAVENALSRRGVEGAEVLSTGMPHFYRVRYEIRDTPLVSILIPFKDRPDLLHCVVGDILERSTYENYEIIGISNNSTETETFEAMEDLSGLDERVRFLEHNVSFNFPALVNFGASAGRGSHLVLLNNDIRLISTDWIEEMLGHSQRPEIGAVGGKLLYPDGRVQHAGVIVGIGEYAGHSHKGFPGDHQGYFNRLQVVQNVSAVTGAFMMVRRELYESVGGFDEEHFAVACNDVDFCLRLREQGVRNVFTPHASAYHVESASRGYEDSPEKQARYAEERRRFKERHGWIYERGDPCYNPNLSLDTEDFSIRCSPRC